MVTELKNIKTRLLYGSEVNLCIIVTVVINSPFLYCRLCDYRTLTVFCNTDDLGSCRNLVVLVKLYNSNFLLCRSISNL